MMRAIKKRYGSEKGEHIYYAKEQEMKKQGKKMGYMGGGMAKKPMATKTGYAKGGVVKANCGASVAPNRKGKK